MTEHLHGVHKVSGLTASPRGVWVSEDNRYLSLATKKKKKRFKGSGYPKSNCLVGTNTDTLHLGHSVIVPCIPYL